MHFSNCSSKKCNTCISWLKNVDPIVSMCLGRVCSMLETQELCDSKTVVNGLFRQKAVLHRDNGDGSKN